jgi:ATP-dependent exoDNAse (exonuclease V) alpha subunit
MLHSSHATMLSRELLYTAVTRAKQELIIFCEGDAKYPNQITAAADRPDIPGTTLADKIAYFTAKSSSFKTA